MAGRLRRRSRPLLDRHSPWLWETVPSNLGRPGNSITAEFGGRRLIVQDAHRIGQLGSGWADRYAALTRKYGWWGIAFLEAILRRADCVVSSQERKGNERH